ncbi:hypothetical protein B0H13DRAFT_1990057 [Mycena leptocephala]|nr:hypothetical protein B0H13DRAFT_1990057 [Mycena leptocephala]
MPTASVVALKAGLTTLSLAHMLILLAPNTALYFKIGIAITPSLIPMIALQLASDMLCPTQKPLYTAEHHRQPFRYLSRILIRNFKEDGKKAVQALAMTHTGGLVRHHRNLLVHEMTVDTFVKTACLYVELETHAKRKLTRDWELLLWLWTKVTGHPDLSTKGMTKMLLKTKFYNVSDPED